MISKTVVVNLPADAEARPVAVLVQIASKYESKITINSQNRRIMDRMRRLLSRK